MTKDADLKAALDWAIAENDRKDSPYFHRLEPSKVAVMGQSCGGLQAIANAADPRVKTVIVWNSGVFPDGSGATRSMSGATKASLAGFHTPVAYINGGPHDAAYINAVDDIKHIENVPVFHGWINVGHGGTYNNPGGGRFAEVGVAWLDWRLNGDKRAARMFEGPSCTLCKDPVWHVEKKNMP
jgi:dienelactone hydrolase